MKNNEGFTLIELMVTVAVVGILVTIATGGFLSYQAKSKQSEAKINLGSIGGMALSYKAENDSYSQTPAGAAVTLDDLGWLPQTITRYRYFYNGVAAVGTPTVIDAGVDYSDPGSAAADNTFTATAVGNVDSDLSSDQWLYDQNRSFTILQNDVITP